MGIIEFSLELEEKAERFFSVNNVMSDRQDIIVHNDDQLCALLEDYIKKESITDFWVTTKVNDPYHLSSEVAFQFGEFEKATFSAFSMIIPVPFKIPE